MAKQHRRRKKSPPSNDGAVTSVAAAEFKSRCLELMDRVREDRVEYVVTKHGTPVARLVPHELRSEKPRAWGALKGTVLRYVRPMDAVAGEWTPERGFPIDTGKA